MPPRLPRVLARTATALSLLLALAAVVLWWNADPDTAAAWTQARHALLATARDSAFHLTLAGPFPDDARARRATHLLDAKRRIEMRLGVDRINAQLMAQHDATVPAARKRREAAAASGDRDDLRVLDPDAEETVLKWENFLAGWVGALVSDKPFRPRQFAGVTLDRGTCRLPVYDPDSDHVTFEPPVPATTLTLPCWLVVLLLTVLPTLALTRTLAHTATLHHRLKHHLCPHCGYDLRASPDRCPECGHAPSPALPDPTTRRRRPD